MRSRFALPAVLFLALAVVAVAVPAGAAFDPDTLKCRAAVAKAGGKLTKTVLKELAACHKQRNTGFALSGTDCNDTLTGDLSGKIAAAAAKFTAYVSTRCAGVDPADALYVDCPDPCDTTVFDITDFGDVGACLTCLQRSHLKSTGATAFGTPDAPLSSNADALCHASIVSQASRLANTAMKTVAKCQAADEKTGVMTIERCTGTDFDSLLASAYTKGHSLLADGFCSTVSLPGFELDACGDSGTADELATCVLDAARSGAQLLIRDFLQLAASTATTTTSTTLDTTTTTLPPSVAECPGSAELTMLARYSNTCANNGDCAAPRTCDTSVGRCSTETALDIGSSGLAHDEDFNEGDAFRVALSCSGPADPGCGTCDVAGIDASGGNCRCTGTNAVCDPDGDDCGLDTCRCYLGTPTPINVTGTSACLLLRSTGTPSGTVDVDAGSATINVPAAMLVYLAQSTEVPCPYCSGVCSNSPSTPCLDDDECGSGNTCDHDVAGDGDADGLCVGGANDGAACDAASTSASWPLHEDHSGGGQYSLDCMPLVGLNISGPGAPLPLHLTTGTDSLTADATCSPDFGAPCHCGVCRGQTDTLCSGDSDCSAVPATCSGASSIACNSDGDCESANVGTCTALGNTRCSDLLSRRCLTNSDCRHADVGTCEASACGWSQGGSTRPNNCDDLECTDVGGGAGACTTGPDDTYCSGVVEADGGGIFACSDDSDCAPPALGFNAGTCTLAQRRTCLPATITTNGTADPLHPIVAGATCMGTTNNAAANSALGLPGPVRVQTQLGLTSFCSQSPATVYTPGGGSCAP